MAFAEFASYRVCVVSRALFVLHATLQHAIYLLYALLRLITKITENRVIPIYVRHLAAWSLFSFHVVHSL